MSCRMPALVVWLAVCAALVNATTTTAGRTTTTTAAAAPPDNTPLPSTCPPKPYLYGIFETGFSATRRGGQHGGGHVVALAAGAEYGWAFPASSRITELAVYAKVSHPGLTPAAARTLVANVSFTLVTTGYANATYAFPFAIADCGVLDMSGEAAAAALTDWTRGGVMVVRNHGCRATAYFNCTLVFPGAPDDADKTEVDSVPAGDAWSLRGTGAYFLRWPHHQVIQPRVPPLYAVDYAHRYLANVPVVFDPPCSLDGGPCHIYAYLVVADAKCAAAHATNATTDMAGRNATVPKQLRTNAWTWLGIVQPGGRIEVTLDRDFFAVGTPLPVRGVEWYTPLITTQPMPTHTTLPWWQQHRYGYLAAACAAGFVLVCALLIAGIVLRRGRRLRSLHPEERAALIGTQRSINAPDRPSSGFFSDGHSPNLLPSPDTEDAVIEYVNDRREAAWAGGHVHSSVMIEHAESVHSDRFDVYYGAGSLGNCIGRGGEAEVYSAVCLAGACIPYAAVKVQTSSNVKRLRDRMRSTLTALDRVQRHTGLLLPEAMYLRNDRELLTIMPLAHASELSRLFVYGPLGEEGFCATAAFVCDAVAFLHAQEIAHGDVKPSNLLYIAGEAMPRLSDFGRATSPRTQTIRLPYGTPQYAPPEWQKRGSVGTTAASRCAADVFMLGVTLLQMAVGFGVEAVERYVRLPPAVSEQLLRMLSTDPAERGTAAAAAAAFRAVRSDDESVAPDRPLHVTEVLVSANPHVAPGGHWGELDWLAAAEAATTSDEPGAALAAHYNALHCAIMRQYEVGLASGGSSGSPADSSRSASPRDEGGAPAAASSSGTINSSTAVANGSNVSGSGAVAGGNLSMSDARAAIAMLELQLGVESVHAHLYNCVVGSVDRVNCGPAESESGALYYRGADCTTILMQDNDEMLTACVNYALCTALRVPGAKLRCLHASLRWKARYDGPAVDQRKRLSLARLVQEPAALEELMQSIQAAAELKAAPTLVRVTSVKAMLALLKGGQRMIIALRCVPPSTLDPVTRRKRPFTMEDVRQRSPDVARGHALAVIGVTRETGGTGRTLLALRDSIINDDDDIVLDKQCVVYDPVRHLVLPTDADLKAKQAAIELYDVVLRPSK